MTSVMDRLLLAAPFASRAPSEDFEAAARECLALLRTRFPDYCEFLDRRGFDSSQSVDDLPAIFLPVLKSYQFTIPDGISVAIRLTSSGTTGQPSITPLDEADWRRRTQAMFASYEALDLFAGDQAALCFLMDPATTKMAGSLVIDAVLRKAPQVRSVAYLARMGSAGPEFPIPAAVAALKSAVQAGPVVFVGYPALIAALMHALAQSGKERFPLPPGSRILTGGGWKSFLPGVSLNQAEFRLKAAGFFGMPAQSIRDMYGLSECPAVFVQCEHGHYHVPAWARAQAIDPESNRDVCAGDIGLLQLTVPLTASYPLLKILTTDKVRVQNGCVCGRTALHLIPSGRVTAARFETCAMKIGKAVA